MNRHQVTDYDTHYKSLPQTACGRTENWQIVVVEIRVGIDALRVMLGGEVDFDGVLGNAGRRRNDEVELARHFLVHVNDR